MGRHIYVHNPFCARKCPYCGFYSEEGTSRISEYYRCAEAEVRLWAAGDTGDADDGIDTVYFGGGTPSFPDSDKVCSLLRIIREEFVIRPHAEITIEINPSSLTEDKAIAYHEAGFNRVSVGVQSLSDSVLKTLGRLHDSSKAIEAINILKQAGFTNISADLITGVPGQTMEDVLNDIDRFASLGVKHVSTYSLTLEEGTAFYARYKDKLEDLVPPEEERAVYHAVRRRLEELGIIPYEISNSACEGFRSVHNGSYWNGSEYFAIGAGSHGFTNGIRYGHADSIDEYIKVMSSAVPGGGMPEGLIYVEEEMTLEDRMAEYPFLRLRTSEGIDKGLFAQKFGRDAYDVFGEAIQANVSRGLLEDTDGHIRLTERGLDFADAVIRDFLG
ncbi:MAG: radical SAM family heme chaperone HemW [Clostridiales bacterium]|nr:radical SAM family heme chaperone HemW [Clostridiales bacterium]